MRIVYASDGSWWMVNNGAEPGHKSSVVPDTMYFDKEYPVLVSIAENFCRKFADDMHMGQDQENMRPGQDLPRDRPPQGGRCRISFSRFSKFGQEMSGISPSIKETNGSHLKEHNEEPEKRKQRERGEMALERKN